MADEKKTARVEAIEPHSYNGESYEIGDTYDIDEALVDSVTAQGKAIAVDRKARAARAAAPAKATRAKATPVKARGRKRT